MQEIELLLSDEFLAFSQRIGELHLQKKDVKQKLKAYYETIQSELKELDDEAKKISAEFELWKNSQTVVNKE